MKNKDLFSLISLAANKNQKAQTQLINLFWVDVFSFVMKKVQHEHVADEITVSRDYDSVIGFGKHIFLDCDITLHLVPKLEDTLRRNVHIKRDFTNIHVRTTCYTL